MARGERDHLGTFAQLRYNARNTQYLLYQRLTGQRVDPYAGLPEITQHTITPEIRARAEELVLSEQDLPASMRKGYFLILAGLVNGTLS